MKHDSWTTLDAAVMMLNTHLEPEATLTALTVFACCLLVYITTW